MPAIAHNFRYILFIRILAVVAAIFLVAANRAGASFMTAFVIFVCHRFYLSLIRLELFAAFATNLIIKQQT